MKNKSNIQYARWYKQKYVSAIFELLLRKLIIFSDFSKVRPSLYDLQFITNRVASGVADD